MEVHVDGYKIKPKDRGTLSGGVAIYVKNETGDTRRIDLEESDIEAICVELKFRKVIFVLIELQVFLTRF